MKRFAITRRGSMVMILAAFFPLLYLALFSTGHGAFASGVVAGMCFQSAYLWWLAVSDNDGAW